MEIRPSDYDLLPPTHPLSFSPQTGNSVGYTGNTADKHVQKYVQVWRTGKSDFLQIHLPFSM